MSEFLKGLNEDQKSTYNNLEGEVQKILTEKLKNTPVSEREASFSILKMEAEAKANEGEQVVKDDLEDTNSPKKVNIESDDKTEDTTLESDDTSPQSDEPPLEPKAQILKKPEEKPKKAEAIREMSNEEEKPVGKSVKIEDTNEEEEEGKEENTTVTTTGEIIETLKAPSKFVGDVKGAVVDGIMDSPLGGALGVLGGLADYFSSKPHPNFCFNVHFIPNALSLALLADPMGWNFQEVSGIEYSMDTEGIREGGENRFEHRVPTRATYGNLTLKRAMKTRGLTTALAEWCVDSVERDLSKRIKTADVVVSLLGTTPAASILTDSNMPIAAWHFRNAYPVKWNIRDFNAQSGEILIEEIELCYSYFTRKL